MAPRKRDRAIQKKPRQLLFIAAIYMAIASGISACTYTLEYDQTIRAIEDLDEAIRLNPNSAAAYNNRGNAYNDLGQHTRAIQDYDQAIRLNPNLTVAYYNRGNTYKTLGLHTRAIEDYDQALRLNPKGAMTYNNRGYAYVNLGQYDRAIQDYDEALRLIPKYVKAYINRGIAYYDLGQYDRAIEDYDQAIRLDPKNAAAYNSKAWQLATAASSRYRNGKEAVKAALKAVQLNDAADNRDTLAAAYAEAGQFSNAVAEAEKAVEMVKSEGLSENIITDFESRLNLYRQQKPYHQEPN